MSDCGLTRNTLPMIDIHTCKKHHQSNFLVWLALLTIVFCSACSNTTTVSAEFPSPLVEKIPLVVSYRFSDEFKQYRYLEQQSQRAKLTLELGAAQTELFSTIIADLFTHQSQPNDQPNGQPNSQTNYQLTPSLVDFQYSVPRETNDEIYEVWLKYDLQLTDNNHATVAQWQLSGYGKTPTAKLKSRQKALNIATNIALRDVGAQLSLTTKSLPDIRDLIAKQRQQ